jgi:hypothetical protein
MTAARTRSMGGAGRPDDVLARHRSRGNSGASTSIAGSRPFSLEPRRAGRGGDRAGWPWRELERSWAEVPWRLGDGGRGPSPRSADKELADPELVDVVARTSGTIRLGSLPAGTDLLSARIDTLQAQVGRLLRPRHALAHGRRFRWRARPAAVAHHASRHEAGHALRAISAEPAVRCRTPCRASGGATGRRRSRRSSRATRPLPHDACGPPSTRRVT